MDLAGVDLVEQLHQHERVEDDGVVFGGRSVQGGVPPAVDVEQFLSCGGKGDGGEASGLFNDQRVPAVDSFYTVLDAFANRNHRNRNTYPLAHVRISRRGEIHT